MKPFTSLIQTTIFLSLLIATQSSIDQNLVDSTCGTLSANDPNIDYNFCTTSLQATPSNAILQTLGLITIQLVEENVTDTKLYVQRMISIKKWDPYAKQCLRDCLEVFSGSVASMKQAVTEYIDTLFGEANVRISSVMDAATTCEEGFEEGCGFVFKEEKRRRVPALSYGTLSD